MSDLIERAARFAAAAHEGQKRKYTGEPCVEPLQRSVSVLRSPPTISRRNLLEAL
jgi:hypothetical protein